MGTPKKEQFEVAYTEHSDALFRFCYFKLNDRELAQDVLQDTFAKAWQYMAKGGKVGNIKAFLYKIMSNLIIDEYRKRKPIDSLETLHEEGFDPSMDDTDRWFDTIDGAEAIQLIRRIPNPYGEALFMRYVQDLSLGEIADITGEKENAIAVRIHRALEKLRTIYYDHETKE